MRDALGAARGGDWLRGRGWRSADWPPVEPTKEALDEVTGETPVALLAHDSHSLWLNSAALARANGELEVAGGVVERDERGEPTGVLREEACWHFRDRHVEISDDEYVESMRDGLRVARGPRGHRRPRQGRLARARWATGSGCEAEQAAHAPGLAVAARTSSSTSSRAIPAPPRPRRRPAAARLPEGVHGRDARLADRAACSTAPASRSRAARSSRRSCAAARRAGWPVAVHAIGDRANRDALDAFEETRDDWAPLGLRQRIEHAQLLAPEDIRRFAELGVAASVQFSHAPSDRDLADRFWAGKTDGAYAFRSLLGLGRAGRERLRRADRGARPARRDRAPASCGRSTSGAAWHPEQALTVEQALRATCVTPAWLADDEHRRGKLLPGYLRRPGRARPRPARARAEELPDVEVVATMVGGRWTHNPPPWD